jgi:Protein of unknown function (DUF2723)
MPNARSWRGTRAPWPSRWAALALPASGPIARGRSASGGGPDLAEGGWSSDSGLFRLIFLAALATYAGAIPLGLERPIAGATVAAGCGLDPAPSSAPLALLAIRLFAFLPLGDLATRAALASAVAGALAVALVGSLARQAVTAARASAGSPGRPDLLEPLAATAAAAVFALSLRPFGAATGPGASAVSLALVAAAWGRAVRLARAPQQMRHGLTLALLAGLASGAEAAAVPLVWGPALVLWIRGLRRRDRWTLVAPLLFVAGAAVLLFAVAAGGAPVTAREALGRLWSPTVRVDRWAAAVEAGEQLGVPGLLLAGVGLALSAWRAPLPALVVAGAAAAGLWISGDAVTLAMAAAAAPLAVGIAAVAGRFGRAHLATAAAVAVMAVASVALDGGAARWRRDPRVAARLLERALEQSPLRARIDPGSASMDGLFRYARLIGLRRDLSLDPGSGPARRGH